MERIAKSETSETIFADIVSGVEMRIEESLRGLDLSAGGVRVAELILSGKLLRTRLAARLAVAGIVPIARNTLEGLCAATELSHTASICHDDVIDGGILRRGIPALWRTAGLTGAVLIGDLLLCQALNLLLDAEEGRFMPLFVSKIQEVCRAEAEQELISRGKPLEQATCLRLARFKTGPLFAFLAKVCADDAPALASALEEAAYRIGTAYQLADDLLDFVGSEDLAGKTLGTDLQRCHWTLPRVTGAKRGVVRAHVEQLCSSALDCVGAWPRARYALKEFLTLDVKPVFDRHGGELYDLMKIS